MKRNIITKVLIALTVLTAGCRASQLEQSPDKETVVETGSKGEVRSFIILPSSWSNSDELAVKTNIDRIISGIAEANYNTVIFTLEGNPLMLTEIRSGQPGIQYYFEQLKTAIEAAHHHNLHIYAGIDLTGPEPNEADVRFPQIKTYLKSFMRQLVSCCNIDGISLKPSRYPVEFLEDLFAEAMLMKPYLVSSLLYTGREEHETALKCFREGIADLIIPSMGNNEKASGILQDRFQNTVKIPDNLKKITPEQVVGLDLSEIFPDNKAGIEIMINPGNKTKLTDSEGCIGFIMPETDSIQIITSSAKLVLKTRNWLTPYKYSVQPDGGVIRKSPWVEFRRMPKNFTDVPEFELLCKTEYPAHVRINNDSVKLYKTGIFFKRIHLMEGPNRIRADIITPDSLSAFYEREFVYRKTDKMRAPLPLWIDERSVEPSVDLELLPEDAVHLRFHGSSSQEAFAEIKPGKIIIKCSREDHEDYSIYMADLPLRKLVPGKSYTITIGLISKGTRTEKKLSLELQNKLKVRLSESFPLVKIINENTRLAYNQGEIRLGGPVRAELGPGTILKTDGIIGDSYRIRLSSVENGMILKSDVEILPSETVHKTYFITSLSCAPSESSDVLTIPYPEPVPYEIHPEPDQNRITITLFGVQTSSTWITHRTGRRIIDKVTWEQTTPETYKINVNLRNTKVWGYDIRPEGRNLVLRVKYPPKYDLKNEKPLEGLKIAIEAGHGGLSTGAVGLSGLLEKDINLDLSYRLGDLCRSMGAEIVQVRDSDKDMTLIEKRDIAVLSGSDLLISIHANAGGRGYLQVAGTSTYYHNPFWAPFAESVYDRLLELGLDEFGVVGSFNYTVTRVSQMPAILVEQAFLSHAADEEKLANPQFRQRMAQKIVQGIIDYLGHMTQQ